MVGLNAGNGDGVRLYCSRAAMVERFRGIEKEMLDLKKGDFIVNCYIYKSSLNVGC